MRFSVEIRLSDGQFRLEGKKKGGQARGLVSGDILSNNFSRARKTRKAAFSLDLFISHASFSGALLSCITVRRIYRCSVDVAYLLARQDISVKDAENRYEFAFNPQFALESSLRGLQGDDRDP